MANRIPKIYVASLLKDGALIPYEEALQIQQQAWELVRQEGDGFFFLLEHPPVITYGKRSTDVILSAKHEGSLFPLPSYKTDRGGETTYHGPGQIVGYPIFPLLRLRLRPRLYVEKITDVLNKTLQQFEIHGEKGKHPGVWVLGKKVGFIGVRISRGVSRHGFAMNLSVDLTPYKRIKCCGLTADHISSLAALGFSIERNKFISVLFASVVSVFGVETIPLLDCGNSAICNSLLLRKYRQYIV